MSKVTQYAKGGKILWYDRKRYLGLPISFTRYFLIRNKNGSLKFIRDKGFFSRDIEQINLFRIDDISLHESLLQRIFGVGTITIFCKDASCDNLLVKSIARPRKITDLLNNLIEEDRANKKLNVAEIQH